MAFPAVQARAHGRCLLKAASTVFRLDLDRLVGSIFGKEFMSRVSAFFSN